MRQLLKIAEFDTKLGQMTAVAGDAHLYLLEFSDQVQRTASLAKLVQKTQAQYITGSNAILETLQRELRQYFEGRLETFQTPIFLLGSAFQQQVWTSLQTIPIAQTHSYQALASAVGRPRAYRAVANANAANRIAILVPCHRVVRSNGDLGGYAGGVDRKTWLIQHEQSLIKERKLSYGNSSNTN